MKKVAVTGGIGTGKTTVSKLFEKIGIPVFNSDEIAKELMHNDKQLQAEIIKVFGDESYINNELNRAYLSDVVFNDEALLDKINSIVHPYVAKEFNQWLLNQKSDYILYESAIIFENNSEDIFDKIICVIAPEEDVISRVMKRNNFSRNKVISIINNQLPDQIKRKKSDYIVENINKSDLTEKIMEIHNMIIG
ncbi:MAG: dephospho-CoA kinase [Flavobacteriales bacterium]|nr:MAG: dephospho-CoA kinase [Flavobacteriales bacterium]|tara:strand:- start:213 stop:791 length:579 start_codon:yes stop_codon:yes gene_type:complete